jgi:hypothetical protein
VVSEIDGASISVDVHGRGRLDLAAGSTAFDALAGSGSKKQKGANRVVAALVDGELMDLRSQLSDGDSVEPR